MKRTMETHRIAKERVRVGTWNVRTKELNNGNLKVVKKKWKRLMWICQELVR